MRIEADAILNKLNWEAESMDLKRRQFLAGMGGGLLGTLAMAGTPRWRTQPAKRATAPVRGTARNVIFVLLEGGPSHVDTFDLKTNRTTPDILGVQTLPGGMIWPTGIMPRLAAKTDKFSIVRSLTAVEAVHERAVYHLFTAHRPNPTLANEIPYFESVLSYKFAQDRTATDSLPTVMTIGRPGTNGLFPVEHRGLSLGEEGRIRDNVHYFEGGEARFALLDGLLAELGEPADGRGEHVRIHEQARSVMNDPTLAELFPEEDEDEGEQTLGGYFKKQCDTAIRAIAADKGCRVFRTELGGWDHHDNIYQNNGLPELSRAFDEGFSFLLEDLEARPGKQTGNTLLDETLVVALGEFGRTTGTLNTAGGRDHYPYVLPALLAGGGVQGGRIIGATDSQGALITELGWNRNRYMGIPDFMATVYSALGVDWTERFQDTPSGRVYEIVDTALTGPAYEIDGLF